MKKSQTRKTVTLPQTSKKLRNQSQKLFHIEENLRLTRHRIADLMDDIALLKKALKEKDKTINILWKSLFKLSEKGATNGQTISLLFDFTLPWVDACFGLEQRHLLILTFFGVQVLLGQSW